jgi:hypothetical protein
MKPISLSALASSLVLVCSACESGPRSRPPSIPPSAAGSAPELPLPEQVERLAVASRPGPHHAALASLEGEWDVALSNVGAGTGVAETYAGHATLGRILGGRFLRWDASLAFGPSIGTTTGFLGYDSRYGSYEWVMISDLSQGMEVARGTGELDTSGVLFTLEQTDPRTGGRVRSSSRLRVLERDHFVLDQLEDGADGVERIVRVSHYRRTGAVKR